jgi:hypothetical protein
MHIQSVLLANVCLMAVPSLASFYGKPDNVIKINDARKVVERQFLIDKDDLEQNSNAGKTLSAFAAYDQSQYGVINEDMMIIDSEDYAASKILEKFLSAYKAVKRELAALNSLDNYKRYTEAIYQQEAFQKHLDQLFYRWINLDTLLSVPSNASEEQRVSDAKKAIDDIRNRIRQRTDLGTVSKNKISAFLDRKLPLRQAYGVLYLYEAQLAGHILSYIKDDRDAAATLDNEMEQTKNTLQKLQGYFAHLIANAGYVTMYSSDHVNLPDLIMNAIHPDRITALTLSDSRRVVHPPTGQLSEQEQLLETLRRSRQDTVPLPFLPIGPSTTVPTPTSSLHNPFTPPPLPPRLPIASSALSISPNPPTTRLYATLSSLHPTTQPSSSTTLMPSNVPANTPASTAAAGRVLTRLGHFASTAASITPTPPSTAGPPSLVPPPPAPPSSRPSASAPPAAAATVLRPPPPPGTPTGTDFDVWADSSSEGSEEGAVSPNQFAALAQHLFRQSGATPAAPAVFQVPAAPKPMHVRNTPVFSQGPPLPPPVPGFSGVPAAPALPQVQMPPASATPQVSPGFARSYVPSNAQGRVAQVARTTVPGPAGHMHRQAPAVSGLPAPTPPQVTAAPSTPQSTQQTSLSLQTASRTHAGVNANTLKF